MIFRKAKLRDYTGLRNLRERSHEILLKLSVAAGIPQNPFYKHEVSTSKKNIKKGHVWTCTYQVPDFVYLALGEPRIRSPQGDRAVVTGVGNDVDSDYALSLSALEVMYYLEHHRLRPAREQAFIRCRAQIPLGTRLGNEKRYELTHEVHDNFMTDSILAKLVLKYDREQAAQAAAATTTDAQK